MRSQAYRRLREQPLIDDLAERRGAGPESLLPILQEVQACRGFLDPPALGATSDKLGIPDARTFGAASFYSMLSTLPRTQNVIRVCDGPVCALHGCQEARVALEAVADSGAWCIERTSCLGLCDRAPAALVNLEASGPLAAERAPRLLEGWRGSPADYAQRLPGEVRIAMARIGGIDPHDLNSALAAGAYQSLAKAIMSDRRDVLAAVTNSGLQGRGGAGFPTGKKWQFVAEAADAPKYIVCNADESEPASFKDRVLMEGDPQQLLEGMALAGYAVGAGEGIIYIRGEYEQAAGCLEAAIQQAELAGWLGDGIQGSEFSFRIHVHRGAGAYICGEETALLESLEGRRGEPRIRPPFPTTHGFRGQPTVVNNVETLCKVPAIIAHGAAWYRSMGTANSPGTKLFTVTGHVNRGGAFEAPFGITLRDIIDNFAGGMTPGAAFKMALTGGAAGTLVDESVLDVPLDFASARRGVSLGAGAVVVFDQTVSVSAVLGWLLRFFEVESCGKCTPCREGTREARIIVERLHEGRGREGDLDQLRRLSRMLRVTSFCGLGQSVAWPLDSALTHFGDELRALERP